MVWYGGEGREEDVGVVGARLSCAAVMGVKSLGR
jgi:hypothetical protein